MVMYPWSLYTVAIDFLIIPEPVSYESNMDIFVLGSDLRFDIRTKDEQANKYTNQFKILIENAGIKVINEKTKEGNSLTIKQNSQEDTELGKEGYKLFYRP
jgi:hypothetical protein